MQRRPRATRNMLLLLPVHVDARPEGVQSDATGGVAFKQPQRPQLWQEAVLEGTGDVRTRRVVQRVKRDAAYP